MCLLEREFSVFCLHEFFHVCIRANIVTVPAYPHRTNGKFIPMTIADYGDGGAFPEIHVVQYPLDMGRPGVASTAVISVNVDEKGQISYDALVKQGANKNKIVQTSLDDVKEKSAKTETVALPDEKEEQETAEKTRQALEALLESKIRSSKPSTITNSAETQEPTYIRYTPNPNAPG
jgi:SNW domain-containing protein 1